jgi:hypothetical protein
MKRFVGHDNVHLLRDNPNVPSDLEQMPHLFDFLIGNGTVDGNHHTPPLAQKATGALAILTGLYGDRMGVPHRRQLRLLPQRRQRRLRSGVRLLDRDRRRRQAADAGRCRQDRTRPVGAVHARWLRRRMEAEPSSRVSMPLDYETGRSTALRHLNQNVAKFDLTCKSDWVSKMPPASSLPLQLCIAFSRTSLIVFRVLRTPTLFAMPWPRQPLRSTCHASRISPYRAGQGLPRD